MKSDDIYPYLGIPGKPRPPPNWVNVSFPSRWHRFSGAPSRPLRRTLLADRPCLWGFLVIGEGPPAEHDAASLGHGPHGREALGRARPSRWRAELGGRWVLNTTRPLVGPARQMIVAMARSDANSETDQNPVFSTVGPGTAVEARGEGLNWPPRVLSRAPKPSWSR
jgi:hypothetical protein